MTPLRVRAALLLIVAAACRKTAPVDVAAVVNNQRITFAELDKAFQARFDPSDRSSPDQIMIQKLEILRGLIDNEILRQRAEKLGLTAVDADVETKLNELKAPYTREEFQKQLDAQKITLEDLKQRIRRDLTIQKLFNKLTFHIDITDAEVAAFYNANKAGFNFAEPQVHMAQILVTPYPDPNVRNLKNDKVQNDEQARKKIQMIEQRLKQGDDFAMLAQNYSEDPATAANGGDLGFVPQSSLDKVPVELRRLILALQPGQLSQIIRSQEGYRILKVFSKEPSGQRTLEDPRVQQTIRETLRNRKDQLLRAAYYEVARNQATVVNYLAQSTIQAAEKEAK